MVDKQLNDLGEAQKLEKKMYNQYFYGSEIYGTSDNESDIDLIAIVKDKDIEMFENLKRPDDSKYDFSYYSIKQFKKLIKEHDPCALECLFLPNKCKIEFYKFNFELDIETLRRSFSQKSSNSWVKAKKKIDLHQEYRKGRKSLFHSLRLLDFGIQIVNHGRIKYYTSANHYLEKIKEQNYTSWNEYKEYWQPEYNRMKSSFRLAAPLKD